MPPLIHGKVSRSKRSENEGEVHGAGSANQETPRPPRTFPGSTGEKGVRLAPDHLELGNRPHLPRRAKPPSFEHALRRQRRRPDQRRRGSHGDHHRKGPQNHHQTLHRGGPLPRRRHRKRTGGLRATRRRLGHSGHPHDPSLRRAVRLVTLPAQPRHETCEKPRSAHLLRNRILRKKRRGRAQRDAEPLRAKPLDGLQGSGGHRRGVSSAPCSAFSPLWPHSTCSPNPSART